MPQLPPYPLIWLFLPCVNFHWGWWPRIRWWQGSIVTAEKEVKERWWHNWFFKAVDLEDLSKGFTCEICECMTNVYLFLPNNEDSHIYRDMKQRKLIKYVKLQTVFKGSTSSLHTHISQMGMGWYWECCIMKDLEMHDQCIPEEELNHLIGKSDSKEWYICSVF